MSSLVLTTINNDATLCYVCLCYCYVIYVIVMFCRVGKANCLYLFPEED